MLGRNLTLLKVVLGAAVLRAQVVVAAICCLLAAVPSSQFPVRSPQSQSPAELQASLCVDNVASSSFGIRQTLWAAKSNFCMRLQVGNRLWIHAMFVVDFHFEFRFWFWFQVQVVISILSSELHKVLLLFTYFFFLCVFSVFSFCHFVSVFVFVGDSPPSTFQFSVRCNFCRILFLFVWYFKRLVIVCTQIHNAKVIFWQAYWGICFCIGSLPAHTHRHTQWTSGIRDMKYGIKIESGANMKLICYAKNFAPGGLKPKSTKAFASQSPPSLFLPPLLPLFLCPSL